MNLKAIKNWWYGYNGPGYKWYKLTRWVNVRLAKKGWPVGNCAACSKTTKDFDSYFEWHICRTCSSDEVAYGLTEYVHEFNTRFDRSN